MDTFLFFYGYMHQLGLSAYFERNCAVSDPISSLERQCLTCGDITSRWRHLLVSQGILKQSTLSLSPSMLDAWELTRMCACLIFSPGRAPGYINPRDDISRSSVGIASGSPGGATRTDSKKRWKGHIWELLAKPKPRPMFGFPMSPVVQPLHCGIVALL